MTDERESAYVASYSFSVERVRTKTVKKKVIHFFRTEDEDEVIISSKVEGDIPRRPKTIAKLQEAGLLEVRTEDEETEEAGWPAGLQEKFEAFEKQMAMMDPKLDRSWREQGGISVDKWGSGQVRTPTSLENWQEEHRVRSAILEIFLDEIGVAWTKECRHELSSATCTPAGKAAKTEALKRLIVPGALT